MNRAVPRIGPGVSPTYGLNSCSWTIKSPQFTRSWKTGLQIKRPDNVGHFILPHLVGGEHCGGCGFDPATFLAGANPVRRTFTALASGAVMGSTGVTRQDHVMAGARPLAELNGISLNQFLSSLIAAGTRELRANADIRLRAERANRAAALSILSQVPDPTPLAGDALPGRIEGATAYVKKERLVITYPVHGQ